MNDRPIRVGMIGLGRMGRNHLRLLSLLKSADLVFAYDPDEAVMNAACEPFGIAPVDDLESALGTIDAVVIASPTSTHAALIEQASRKVANILVEKPIAATIEEAEAVAALSRQAAINVQVGFIERFNPAVDQLRRVLDSSSGVVSVDFTRTNKISARITDVDVITDLMIHDLDLAIHLNGPVEDVRANGTHRDGLIEFATATLTHRSGSFSRVLASRITEKKIRRIEATAQDMFVDCDLLRKEIVISRQSEVVQPAGEPYTITAQEQTLEVQPREALLLELQAFLSSCRNGPLDPRSSNAAAGLAATRLAEDVRSAILNRQDSSGREQLIIE